MKRYEVTVEEGKSQELLLLLKTLPYVTEIHESESEVDIYSVASQQSLSVDWLLEDDDELQNLYGK